jgi:hypothetical protein
VGYLLWATLVWVGVESGCWPRSLAPAARPGGAREAVHAA